jgi:hypothetical protein
LNGTRVKRCFWLSEAVKSVETGRLFGTTGVQRFG